MTNRFNSNTGLDLNLASFYRFIEINRILVPDDFCQAIGLVNLGYRYRASIRCIKAFLFGPAYFHLNPTI
jgi:hypothetical protein